MCKIGGVSLKTSLIYFPQSHLHPPSTDFSFSAAMMHIRGLTGSAGGSGRKNVGMITNGWVVGGADKKNFHFNR